MTTSNPALLRYHIRREGDNSYAGDPSCVANHRWQKTSNGRIARNINTGSTVMRIAGVVSQAFRKLYPFGNYDPRFDAKLINASQSFALTVYEGDPYQTVFNDALDNITTLRSRTGGSGPRSGAVVLDGNDRYFKFSSRVFSPNNPFETKPDSALNFVEQKEAWYNVGMDSGVCATVTEEEWEKALTTHHLTPMQVFDGPEFWNPAMLPSKLDNVPVEVEFELKEYSFRDKQVCCAYVKRVNILHDESETADCGQLTKVFAELVQKQNASETSSASDWPPSPPLPKSQTVGLQPVEKSPEELKDERTGAKTSVGATETGSSGIDCSFGIGAKALARAITQAGISQPQKDRRSKRSANSVDVSTAESKDSKKPVKKRKVADRFAYVEDKVNDGPLGT